MRLVYYVKPQTYHGADGFRVGSRGNGGWWPLSIWVPGRPEAETIRDAYTAAERGHITTEEREVLVGHALTGQPFESIAALWLEGA